VVWQCLAKDPAHRPASYRVLANVLEPLVPPSRRRRRLGFGPPPSYSMTLFHSPALNILAGYGAILTGHVVLVNPSSQFSATSVVGHLLLVAYFAITEGVWAHHS